MRHPHHGKSASVILVAIAVIPVGTRIAVIIVSVSRVAIPIVAVVTISVVVVSIAVRDYGAAAKQRGQQREDQRTFLVVSFVFSCLLDIAPPRMVPSSEAG